MIKPTVTSTKVTSLTESNMRTLVNKMKVKNQMPKDMYSSFKKQGWKFSDFAMEKKVNNLYIDIEFCIGDFCVGVYSKNGKWLLEPKQRCSNFIEALLVSASYEKRIKDGEHWKGEED